MLKGTSSRLRSGLTLLELLIILAMVIGVVMIALPTMRPTAKEAMIERVKDNLRYLASEEEKYFVRHGTYAPLQKLAEDEVIGRTFDRRFAVDTPVIDGVVYTGPQKEASIFDIVAQLPGVDDKDGARYKIDRSGEVKSLQ